PETHRRCTGAPTVEIAAVEVALRDGRAPAAEGWERLVDHGLALAEALVDRAGDALGPLSRAAALAPDRPEPQLGLARLAVALGRTDEALAILDRLEARGGAPPAALWLRA